MQQWRHPRLANPANWFLLLGGGLLALSLWIPWFTAVRTARVENRADQITGLLLEAATGLECPLDAAGLEIVMARFQALAAAQGAHLADLERIEPAWPGALLALTSKHYAYQLAISPPPVRSLPSRDSTPALETMAWPLSAVGPGHSVFFHPENAPRAYTRNKAAGFEGLTLRPAAGEAHRPGEGSVSANYYRSARDERWIHY